MLFLAGVVRFFLCGGFSNKRESCIYDSVYYLRREKNDQKHPQHHVFLGECFSSSVRMYVFLYGNMTLVVFSKQRGNVWVLYYPVYDRESREVE
jgi:hypothetical protein